jgi:CheY-like chemotaxis protein
VPHTLLLADDSVTIQRVIELTFADEDIRVVAVGDGDQAIEVLDSTPPDIVLADVGMPGRNGYEVAQHIKDTPHLAHIPVLLLTGAFEPIDQARAAAVGCDGVLAKPFEPQLVIARVKELLARPKIPAALDSPLAPPPAPAGPWGVLSGASGVPGIFDEPTVVRGPVKTETADVDHYFDRLDQAFANLSNPGQEVPEPAVRSVADEIDWFATVPPGPAAPDNPPPPVVDRWMPPPPASLDAPIDDLPLAAPAREPDPPFVHPSAQPTPVPAPRPPLAPPPSTLPPLADAFAALLAAEQSAPMPPPAWPPPPARDAVVSEEVIEEIVTRVLARLSDRVVRETVADIASAAAERLVREEIDRIKRSIE